MKKSRFSEEQIIGILKDHAPIREYEQVADDLEGKPCRLAFVQNAIEAPAKRCRIDL